jgi:two-component system NarL family sensor kinase
MAGAGMTAVLVGVTGPTDVAIAALFAAGLLWLALSTGVVLRPRWTARASYGVAVVDLGFVVAAIALTEGVHSNALPVLWLAPLAGAVVADRTVTVLLLVLGAVSYLAMWVPRVTDGDPGMIAALATFGSTYLAGLAVAFVALRLRTQADAHAAELADARTALSRELGEVERGERERLSIQVHDGPLQTVISARQDLVDHLEGDPDALQIGIQTLDESIVSLRAVATDLYPDQDGGSIVQDQLASIAAAWEARGGFRIQLAVEESVGTRSDGMLVAMVAELVGNAAKHASPAVVSIRVRDAVDSVIVDVSDDGKGMTSQDRAHAERSGHIGLRSLDRRIRAIGGDWHIMSAPGRGTAIRLRLPL